VNQSAGATDLLARIGWVQEICIASAGPPSPERRPTTTPAGLILVLQRKTDQRRQFVRYWQTKTFALDQNVVGETRLSKRAIKMIKAQSVKSDKQLGRQSGDARAGSERQEARAVSDGDTLRIIPEGNVLKCDRHRILNYRGAIQKTREEPF
jgi:hypothetical protein